MVDLSAYMRKLGVDDTGFAHPFGMVDEIFDDGVGPIVAVTRLKGTPEEAEKNRRQLIAIAEQIRDRVEGRI